MPETKCGFAQTRLTDVTVVEHYQTSGKYFVKLVIHQLLPITMQMWYCAV